MKTQTQTLAAHSPLWPNLAGILRESAKASAGPYYDEAKTEVAIAYARNAIDTHATHEATIARLTAALTDAEFLMRQAGKYAGPMQDSFNRSAEDARAALAASKEGA